PAPGNARLAALWHACRAQALAGGHADRPGEGGLSDAITSVEELEATIGTPMEIVRQKIVDRLDDLMKEFIARSPLIIVATSDADGEIDVSPKGDPAGFVQVDGQGNLLI